VNQTPHTEIRPHVSGRPSDQSMQLGHPFHLDSRYHSINKKLQLRPVKIKWENYMFLYRYHTENLSLQ
jgi:hypothetical protein